VDLPRLLFDGQSLSPAGRDTEAESFPRHASAKRDIYPELQSPPQAGWPFVPRTVQGDFGGKGPLPVGALPLHSAQSDTGQRRCKDGRLEMEHLPRHGRDWLPSRRF